ncbi:uncharacterized protein TNCV_1894761 [Trichonephila clavipes]|nr:uncharacterized protein TNCV_1894761 [Trichonephila clavipes]
MSSKTFNSYKPKVLNGHLVGSNQLLFDVRKNVREAYGSKNDKDIVDIKVSYDESWLTRGNTSTIGVGCVIDLLTGFVIDYEDVCSATHVGSSGTVEVNAAVKLWERSGSIGFRYTTLLSDGDSKSFLELKERNVYGNQKPQHKKCPSGIDPLCFYQSSLAHSKKRSFHKDWARAPLIDLSRPQEGVPQSSRNAELPLSPHFFSIVVSPSRQGRHLSLGSSTRRVFTVTRSRTNSRLTTSL